MEDGLDWMMRPVLNRLCLYESLKNGALSLLDVALMNEALDIQFENQARVRKAESK